jgi:NADH-quinone oxidoreductase subunit E
VVREEIGIVPNEVSSDNMFSLVPVQCLGSCDTAPVVQINEDYFENLNPDRFCEVIRKLRKGEKVTSSHEKPTEAVAEA